MSRTAICLTLATLSLGAACGAARQTAATQASPAAFDATKSDPKAIAIADEVLVALGGEANWAKAKEIIWFQGIIHDGKLRDASKHAWDRWNGRHQYSRVDPNGHMGVTMREMFNDVSYAYVQTEKGQNPSMRADKEKMLVEAKRRFDTDTYPLVLPYKLKDPGVHLKFAEERAPDGAPVGTPAKLDAIAVTFDPGVGPDSGDTWYLVVDKVTHLPVQVERVLAGKPDTERLGFTYEKWVEAGGLKFATVRTTLGYTKPDAPKTPLDIPVEWKTVVPFTADPVPNPGEIILVAEIKVNAEPTDDLYIPQVTGP